MLKHLALFTILFLMGCFCYGQKYGDSINNRREEFLSQIRSLSSIQTPVGKDASPTKYNGSGSVEYINQIKTSGANDTRYKRISIYTMVTSNHNKPFNIQLINGFGNATVDVPPKYNNHDVGDYIIPLRPSADVQTEIKNHLNENNIAKQLLAKWFRRNFNGEFDMALVADRGEYDASFLEKSLAEKTVRGLAMLQDAGEELIAKTFVCVYDFNFVELKKEYAIAINCYLYRLVWDDETASIFYNNYWVGNKSDRQERIIAFNNSSDFKLKYEGMITMGDVMIDEKKLMRSGQQGFVKNKTDSAMIASKITYFKFSDVLLRAFSELERNFEEFRTKFPLYSIDPIAAKIGKKEGLQAGDKFEVLEKIRHQDGAIEYKRVGLIAITDDNLIWDNDTVGDWLGTTKSKLPYTVFEGDKNKFTLGMLIRKIYSK